MAEFPTLYVVVVNDVPLVFGTQEDSDAFAEYANGYTDDIQTYELLSNGKLDDLAASMRLIDKAYGVPR